MDGFWISNALVPSKRQCEIRALRLGRIVRAVIGKNAFLLVVQKHILHNGKFCEILSCNESEGSMLCLMLEVTEIKL